MPGIPPGPRPRQLVEKRFRKQVAGQVKSVLLMATLEQIDEDHKLNPISQPDLDVEAIELPEDGPMTFEMDVEVRPDFPLPAYKALTIKSPVRAVTEADIDAQVTAFRERYAQLVPKLEGGAEVGDFVTANLATSARTASTSTTRPRRSSSGSSRSCGSRTAASRASTPSSWASSPRSRERPRPRSARVGRPGPPRPVDAGDLRGPRPQAAPPARAGRRVLRRRPASTTSTTSGRPPGRPRERRRGVQRGGRPSATRS